VDATGVRSVERALAILDAVASDPRGMTEIARLTRLPKGTVARLLATLEAQGAVTRDPDSRYRLGPLVARLVDRAASGPDLLAIARPELERLALRVGEAAGLSVAEGSLVRTIAQASTTHEVQVRDWTGTTAPIHAVSSGHVFLAAMSRDEVRALLPSRLEALTPRTITRRVDLERRLAEVRRTGHAWVRDEFAEGLTSVAAPIRDTAGVTIMAVHVHGPSYRFPRRGSEAAVVERVIDTARRIAPRPA
jgi:DNA-binding IclR family transcriptional regulator